MIIDLAAGLLLVMALYKGWTKGLVLALFSFLSFFIGLAAALKLSALVAGYLASATNLSARWLPVLAFLIVFIGVALLVRLGARAIEGVLQLAALGWLNRLGGILFYALLYLFIFSILLFYADSLHLFRSTTTEASLVYPVLKPLGPKMIDALGVLVPFFRDLFAQLQEFFAGR